MNHFVETFFNLGPFGVYSAFVFESINVETKNLIKSTNGMIEEIAFRSEIDMSILLKEETEIKDPNFVTGKCVWENGYQ